jgi:ribonuclease III
LTGTERIRNIQGITEKLGYVFKKQAFLEEALTHKSYHHENRASASSHNERLEFLGDAVFGMIIVEYLYLQEKKYPESVLAKIKSYLVSETVLAEIASSLQLGKYLLLGKGEESTGGREKKSILANAMESVIGAIYLDSGYETAKKVILNFFLEKIDRAVESGEFFDYKTELQERTQSLYGILPEYRVIRQQGEEHKRLFTVAVYLNSEELGTASGRRKKEAENLAAKKALEKIG